METVSVEDCRRGPDILNVNEFSGYMEGSKYPGCESCGRFTE